MTEKKESSEIPTKYVMVTRCFLDWDDAVMLLGTKPGFEQYKENEVAILPCVKHISWKSDHASASVVFRIVDTGKQSSMIDDAREQARAIFKDEKIEKSKYKFEPKPKRKPLGSF